MCVSESECVGAWRVCEMMGVEGGKIVDYA